MIAEAEKRSKSSPPVANSSQLQWVTVQLRGRFVELRVYCSEFLVGADETPASWV